MKKTKKTEVLEFYVNCAWLYRFIWNWRYQTGLWNLKQRKFKILSQQWHWNHTKIVRQLIVINFAKLLPLYRIFFLPELHTGRIRFIIFFLFWILTHFFFLLFSEFSSNYWNFNKPKQSAHFQENRGNLMENEKTELRTSKDIIELIFQELL